MSMNRLAMRCSFGGGRATLPRLEPKCGLIVAVVWLVGALVVETLHRARRSPAENSCLEPLGSTRCRGCSGRCRRMVARASLPGVVVRPSAIDLVGVLVGPDHE